MIKRGSALGLIAGAALSGMATPSSAADRIRLASMAIDGGAQAWYADELGYFKSAGVDPSIEAMTNGSAILAGVIGGTLDVGYSAVLTIAQAFAKGVAIRLIAPAGSYISNAPVSQLMVPVDSTIRTARELNGKTVAINGLKNITQLAVQAWSDQNGGDSKSINFVEMSFPEMPAAMTAHRVDAAFVTEPIVSFALARKSARSIAKPYDAIAPKFTISAWFVTEAWARANPQLVRQVSQIFAQSSAWADSHDVESAQILSKISKIPLDVLRQMTRSRFDEKLSAKELQPVIDSAARYGLLTKAFPASDLIDPNALH